MGLLIVFCFVVRRAKAVAIQRSANIPAQIQGFPPMACSASPPHKPPHTSVSNHTSCQIHSTMQPRSTFCPRNAISFVIGGLFLSMTTFHRISQYDVLERGFTALMLYMIFFSIAFLKCMVVELSSICRQCQPETST